jgi:predicted phosphoribosyltransferase
MTAGFRDRVDASRRRAAHLRERNDTDPMVLRLPRGGVPVAAEVATELETRAVSDSEVVALLWAGSRT